MQCLHCGKQLALFRRLAGKGEFCSAAHKASYHEEYNKLAVSRLLQAQQNSDELRAAAPRAQNGAVTQQRETTPNGRNAPQSRADLTEPPAKVLHKGPEKTEFTPPEPEAPEPPQVPLLIQPMPAPASSISKPHSLPFEAHSMKSECLKPEWNPNHGAGDLDQQGICGIPQPPAAFLQVPAVQIDPFRYAPVVESKLEH